MSKLYKGWSPWSPRLTQTLSTHLHPKLWRYGDKTQPPPRRLSCGLCNIHSSRSHPDSFGRPPRDERDEREEAMRCDEMRWRGGETALAPCVRVPFINFLQLTYQRQKTRPRQRQRQRSSRSKPPHPHHIELSGLTSSIKPL